jgi:hypothetical protein
MAGKFEIYKDKAGEFRFRLKAGNGQNILASEGYKKKPSALNGIESVKKNAAEPKRFVSSQTPGGKWRFVLTSTNGQTIGTSQSYADEAGCKKGIDSVARTAAGAALDDQTS